jgi:CheY-like chemotaxis protein
LLKFAQNCGMNSRNFALPLIKILVVDDYPNTASLLARSLLRLDARVEVISAMSAQQALDRVQNGTVQIVITEMDMPELTGLELIQSLQERSAGNLIISFLITASPTQELRSKARELKVREVFHKPVSPEKVCQIVSRVLEEMQGALP